MTQDIKFRYDMDSDILKQKAKSAYASALEVSDSFKVLSDSAKACRSSFIEAAKAISPKFNIAFAQAVEDIYFDREI